MMSIVCPRYDIARFGAETMRASPRQADMLILSGRVSIKMAPVVRRLYDQMLEPKWVISMGACSSSGGMFANYAVVQGADKFMPVDIHVPGCPPRPEALLYGFNKLQRMILGNPDPGWRRRYNAIGTEEWARPHRHGTEGGGRGVRRGPGGSPSPVTPSWPGKAADARRPRPRADRPGAQRRRSQGSVLGTYHEHGQACLIVDPERILDVLGWLRDTPGQEYRFLASLHGVDYLPAEPRFGVLYELLNMARVERLRVRAALADPGRATELPRRSTVLRADALPDRRLPGARGLRLLRHRLPRPSRPAAHPDARGLRRLAAAPRLPDRRRAGDLHPQRARSPGVVRVSDPWAETSISRTDAQVIGTSPIERTAAGRRSSPSRS